MTINTSIDDNILMYGSFEQCVLMNFLLHCDFAMHWKSREVKFCNVKALLVYSSLIELTLDGVYFGYDSHVNLNFSTFHNLQKVSIWDYDLSIFTMTWLFNSQIIDHRSTQSSNLRLVAPKLSDFVFKKWIAFEYLRPKPFSMELIGRKFILQKFSLTNTHFAFHF